MTSEEFFMYLTIALIVLVPLTARLYRYVAAKHVRRSLEAQLSHPHETAKQSGSEKQG